MEVLLDTNFIISCIIKRIDFLEELKEMGFKVKVPKEVLQEMKDLRKDSKVGYAEREAIDIAFKMFEQEKIKKMSLGGAKVDDGLIVKGREGTYIATLDRRIKRETANKIVIDNAKKGLRVARD